MALAERERWLLWAPVFFGLGIAGYFFAAREPEPWAGPVLAGFALVAALAVWRFSQIGLLLALALLLSAAGFSVAGLRSLEVAAPVMPEGGRAVTLQGIVDRVEQRPGRPRITVSVESMSRIAAERTPSRVRFVAWSDPPLQVGDRIRVRAVLRPPGGPVAPGGFDFRRWAWFNQIGGFGFAIAQHEVLSAVGRPDWRRSLDRLRQVVTERIRARVPDQPGAVASALVTGDRSALSESTLAAMRDAGLAHLLAISGLHLGLVAMTIFAGVRLLTAFFEPLALRYPVKKWAAVAALISSFGYLLLAGAPVPSLRAFLMTGLVLVAVLVDRVGISLRNVAWAAFVVMALAPETLVGPSFQMSFGAVVALVAGYETINRRWPGALQGRGVPTRFATYFAGVLITTAIASVATAPFAWAHFGRLAGYGLIANLAAVPLTAFVVMPMALLALLAMPFGLEGLFLAPAGWAIDAILTVAHTVSAWDGALLHLTPLPVSGLALIVLGSLWLCLWANAWRLFGVVPLTAGLVVGLAATPPDVLISEDGALFGVKAADGGLLISETRRERFVADQWRILFSDVAPRAWNMEGVDDVLCDTLGCVYERAGARVAFSVDARALVEDCRLATVVVARIPVNRETCPGPAVIIDFFALRRDGAHALRIGEGVLTVTAADRGLDRPWVRPGARQGQ